MESGTSNPTGGHKKAVSRRLQKLEDQFLQDGGSYENVRIGDIFEKLPARFLGKGDKFKFVSKIQNEEFCIPLVYAKSGDNGIMYWAKKGDFQTYKNVISIVYNGAIAAGLVYAHKEEVGILAESYLIRLKSGKPSFKANLYMKTALEKVLYPRYSREHLATWANKVENDKIILPHKNGKIAFDYMEQWIAELEADRIAELEAYLMVTGLSNTTLSESENNALKYLNKGVNWKTLNLLKKFGNSTRGKRLKSADRIMGSLPFVTAGEADTGISAYIGNDVEVFPANTITIDMFGSAKYRDYPYGADDHVAVVHTEKMPKYATIFTTTAIHKASHAGQFDYSRNFYAKDADALNIQLPHTPTGELDFDFMENLIRAIEKTVIKDVMAFKDRIIKETKKIVNT